MSWELTDVGNDYNDTKSEGFDVQCDWSDLEIVQKNVRVKDMIWGVIDMMWEVTEWMWEVITMNDVGSNW